MHRRGSSHGDSASGFSIGIGPGSAHVAAIGGLCFTTLFGLADKAPLQETLTIDSRLLMLGALVNLGHWVRHARDGYLRRKGEPATRQARKRLSRVTVLDLVGAFTLMVLAARTVESPTPASVLECAGSGIAIVGIVAERTCRLLRLPELRAVPTGSESFRKLPLVRRLKRWLWLHKRTPVYGSIRVLLSWTTARRQISAYTIGLIFCLTLIFGSAGAARIIHERGKAPISPQALVARRDLRAFEMLVIDPPIRIMHLAQPLVATHAPAQPAAAGYPQDCIGWPEPGFGAHGRAGAELESLYEGGGPVPGAGANVAGCAGITRAEQAVPEHWWVVGWCGSELRSAAIASPDWSAIMLGQVAVFGRLLALRHELLGASIDVKAGAGDFQVLDSRYGDVAFVREESSAGEAHAAKQLGACSPATSVAAPYVVLPPAMTVLWTSLMSETKQWLWPAYGPSEDGRTFTFKSAKSKRPIATGRCAMAGSCSVIIDTGRRKGLHQSLNFTTRGTVTVRELKRYAPPIH